MVSQHRLLRRPSVALPGPAATDGAAAAGSATGGGGAGRRRPERCERTSPWCVLVSVLASSFQLPSLISLSSSNFFAIAFRVIFFYVTGSGFFSPARAGYYKGRVQSRPSDGTEHNNNNADAAVQPNREPGFLAKL